MSEIRLFAKIHTAKEFGRGNLIIDIEVISLDKKGILPNTDFIVKAGGVTKKRTTNNEGVYRNDEVFESNKSIIKVVLLSGDGADNTIEYFLPPTNNIQSGIEFLKDLSVLYAEIESLISCCGYSFESDGAFSSHSFSVNKLNRESGELIIVKDIFYGNDNKSYDVTPFIYSLTSFYLNKINGCSEIYNHDAKDCVYKYSFDLFVECYNWYDSSVENKSIRNHCKFYSSDERIKRLHQIFKHLCEYARD